MEESDEPRVHRVESAYDRTRELRMGVDELLAQGQALLSRDARERAAKKIEEELESTRAARMARAQALADRFEWKPVASVAMFNEQTCANCGEVHSQFLGFGSSMQQKASFTERIAAAPCLDRGYPFQVRTFRSTSPCCRSCILTFAAEAPLAPHTLITNRPESSDASPPQPAADNPSGGLSHAGERSEPAAHDVLGGSRPELVQLDVQDHQPGAEGILHAPESTGDH